MTANFDTPLTGVFFALEVNTIIRCQIIIFDDV